MSGSRAEDRVVVSGVGQSAIGRGLDRSGIALTVDACVGAVADAGLTLRDIDGIATYPGSSPGLATAMPGFAGVGALDAADALRLELNWFTGSMEMPGQLGAVINGMLAIAGGLCRHVLCFRTVTERSAQAQGGRANITRGAAEAERGEALRIGDDAQWRVPFGAFSPANWVALYAQRHFHEFGTTREQLAHIALNARQNAVRNPEAVYRTPLTMEEYLGARMISSPLCLYDCDVPVDGSTAIVLSAVETTADLRRAPLRIEGVGSALRGRASWDQWEDLTTMPSRDAARMMWQRTDLRPADVHVAELYDGFSFLTLLWLEALGFCGHGEGGAFVEGGTRIGRDGLIPLNTHGGQLSAGRMHGFGLLREGCRQLWGEAGSTQLPQQPRVGVVAAGGGTSCGCILLRHSA